MWHYEHKKTQIETRIFDLIEKELDDGLNRMSSQNKLLSDFFGDTEYDLIDYITAIARSGDKDLRDQFKSIMVAVVLKHEKYIASSRLGRLSVIGKLKKKIFNNIANLFKTSTKPKDIEKYRDDILDYHKSWNYESFYQEFAPKLPDWVNKNNKDDIKKIIEKIAK